MTSVKVLSSNIDVMERIERIYPIPSVNIESYPRHINTPLFKHQISALERMKNIESSSESGFTIGKERILSSYGILGERAGTGKTVTMLSHISQMSPLTSSRPLNRLHPSSTPSFFSTISESTEIQFNTLIVVPHTLFHQWETEIKKTTLSCTYLRSLKDIDTESKDKLLVTHITLISNTLLQPLSTLLHNTISYMWDRIVYDEADMIRIPAACIPIHTKMTWLITSRYRNITHANQQIHSHVIKQLPEKYIDSLSYPVKSYILTSLAHHPHLTLYRTASEVYFSSIVKNVHPSRGYVVVKTEETALNQSLSLPPLISQTIQCRQANPRTQDLLDRGMIDEAVLSISPQIVTMDRLLEDADENIKDRLGVANCSICYETVHQLSPCISPCCMNVFCGLCIVKWITINNSCPLCKKTIPSNSLLKIANDTQYPKEKSKMEALLDILKAKGDGQYILFSRNVQEVYSHIIHTLPSLHDEIDILQGNKTMISNILSDFAMKKLRILCFSVDSLGVDLHSATHILVMDRLRDDEEYVIGRAQRIGRKTPLQYIQFCDWIT